MTAPWVQTRFGHPFDLITPTADMVQRGDIAHALSRIARYDGHTIETWTVAEHSLLVADLLASWGCPAAVVREGLLHDAPEAYYGDVTSPVQRALDDLTDGLVCHGLVLLRIRIDRVVRAALSLSEHETPIVKRADLVALAIERRDLMASCERDWLLPEYAPRDWPTLRPTAARIDLATSAGEAIRRAFVARWDALDAEAAR